MSEQSAAGIGDNSSRGLLDIIKQQNAELPGFLAYEHTALIQAIDNLRTECESAPAVVDSDDLEKAATDLGGSLAKIRGQVKNSRKTVKDAVQPGVKIVDEFFNKLDEPIEGLLRTIERRVNAWKDTKRLAAEAARREQERQAAEAKRAADEAARRQREAQEAADRAQQDETATAEEKTALWDAASFATREVIQTHVAAKTIAAEVAAPQPKATTVATGATGAKSLQRTNWVGEITDLEALDLNALRYIITRAALDSAVNAYAREFKGTKPLAGAKIEEKTSVAFKA